MRIGLIGYGAIGRVVEAAISDGRAGEADVIGVLDAAARPSGPDGRNWEFQKSIDSLLDLAPEVVVEMAGHAALRAYGTSILNAGVTLLTVSSGALADEAFRNELHKAARDSGSTMIIPSGAIAGLDGIAALAMAADADVEHVIRKPPGALMDAAAADAVLRTAAPLTLFTGSAAEAATRYPANANVVASVGLAGIGLDQTRVRIVADPALTRNTHEISASSAVGSMHLTIQSEPSATNPKTSAIAAMSVIATLRRMSAWLQVG